MEYRFEVDSTGTFCYKAGTNILHREDGPAIEYADGDKEWYKDGKCHREDGPAIECANGDKFWYKNSKLHRENGPAMEWSNGDKFWYLDGVKMTEEEFLAKTQPAK